MLFGLTSRDLECRDVANRFAKRRVRFLARLRSVLPELAIPSLDTWIVTHEDLRELPRIRAPFDHLAEAFHAYQAIGRNLRRSRC